MGPPPTRSQNVSTMSVDDLRTIIREEVESAITDKVEARLTRMEEQIRDLAQIRTTMTSLEQSMTFTSQRLDDLHKVTLPALASHVEEAISSLALRIMDTDVHSRKWGLSIHGMPGSAGEHEDVTREACVKLAREHLGVADAKADDLAACHRLKQEANAGIIMRFRDLRDRNRWLVGAKKLKNHDAKISISPDLPPLLRPLRKELLQVRKNLPPDIKARSGLRYLAQWPYVELAIPGRDRARASTPLGHIVQNMIQLNPLFEVKEPTGTPESTN